LEEVGLEFGNLSEIEERKFNQTQKKKKKRSSQEEERTRRGGNLKSI